MQYKKEVVKKIVYDELVKNVNVIRTNKLVKKQLKCENYWYWR